MIDLLTEEELLFAVFLVILFFVGVGIFSAGSIGLAFFESGVVFLLGDFAEQD